MRRRRGRLLLCLGNRYPAWITLTRHFASGRCNFLVSLSLFFFSCLSLSLFLSLSLLLGQHPPVCPAGQPPRIALLVAPVVASPSCPPGAILTANAVQRIPESVFCIFEKDRVSTLMKKTALFHNSSVQLETTSSAPFLFLRRHPCANRGYRFDYIVDYIV